MSTRTLPILVRPGAGETAASYLSRLAAANAVSESALWSLARENDPELPYKPAPETAWTVLEELGGLDSGWFARDQARNLLPRRCPHNDWRYARCTRCCRLPEVTPACLKCAPPGTAVRQITGPICLKHEWWHSGGFQFAVTPLAGYVAAERTLRDVLIPRGIGPQTGELALAQRLLAAWTQLEPMRSYSERREALPTRTAAGDLAALFPEVVELAVALTDARITAQLLSPRKDASVQTALLLNAVGRVAQGTPPWPVAEQATAIIDHARAAVVGAYGMVGRSRTSRKVSLERALMAAARTYRACLLRHLDALRLPSCFIGPVTRQAPRTGTFAAAEHVPDPCA